MTAIALIIGMVLMTSFFGGVEQRQRNPNLDPQSQVFDTSVEVPLQRNRQGHYLVKGGINGTEVEFLLDTGATDVVVPEPIARKLGLSYGQQGRAMTANGSVIIYQTRIAKLTIGEITLYDIDASINPSMSSVGILLGMSALGRIEFSQRGNTLTLKQHSD